MRRIAFLFCGLCAWSAYGTEVSTSNGEMVVTENSITENSIIARQNQGYGMSARGADIPAIPADGSPQGDAVDPQGLNALPDSRPANLPLLSDTGCAMSTNDFTLEADYDTGSFAEIMDFGGNDPFIGNTAATAVIAPVISGGGASTTPAAAPAAAPPAPAPDDEDALGMSAGDSGNKSLVDNPKYSAGVTGRYSFGRGNGYKMEGSGAVVPLSWRASDQWTFGAAISKSSNRFSLNRGGGARLNPWGVGLSAAYSSDETRSLRAAASYGWADVKTHQLNQNQLGYTGWASGEYKTQVINVGVNYRQRWDINQSWEMAGTVGANYQYVQRDQLLERGFAAKIFDRQGNDSAWGKFDLGLAYNKDCHSKLTPRVGVGLQTRIIGSRSTVTGTDVYGVRFKGDSKTPNTWYTVKLGLDYAFGPRTDVKFGAQHQFADTNRDYRNTTFTLGLNLKF